MDATLPGSGAERELDALRRRVYGRHPDIQEDPAVLARLAELEAARTGNLFRGIDAVADEPAAPWKSAPVSDVAWAAPGADRPDATTGTSPAVVSGEGPLRSLRQRVAAPGAHSSWLLIGALVLLLELAYVVASLAGPRPDATLHPVAGEADGVVLSVLESLGDEMEPTSMHGYEPYRGVEPWFGVDRRGFRCFMLIQRSGPAVEGANCVPPEVELFADINTRDLPRAHYTDDLPDGSIVRFYYRGDSVVVYLYPAK